MNLEYGSYTDAYNTVKTLVKARCSDCFTFGDGIYWALEKLREGALKLDSERMEEDNGND